MTFSYMGRLPSSKSIFNRALILQSFSNEIEIVGESMADDVVFLRQALRDFALGQTTLNCGSAGTVLRFLALRVARKEGSYALRGSPRLMSRLPEELKRVLMQLGCDVGFSEDAMTIKSWGWKPSGDAIHVPAQNSSQFVSSLLLNSWMLNSPILLILPKNRVSEGYLEMTLQMVRGFGMKFERRDNEIYIPAQQQISPKQFKVEPDMSCAFAIASFASLFGRADLHGFTEVKSLQPDFRFTQILKEIGVSIEFTKNGILKIEKPIEDLKPVAVNLSSTPDLFPVLSVLLSQCSGMSELTGFDHVAHKESNRLDRTLELLRRMEVKFQLSEGNLKIFGRPSQVHNVFFYFDPDQDHRMAMAAALTKKMGYNLEILNPECVTKSFPEFWSIAGVNP